MNIFSQSLAVFLPKSVRALLRSVLALCCVLGVAVPVPKASAGTITANITSAQGGVSGATVTLTRGSIGTVEHIPDDMPADFEGPLTYLNMTSSAGNIFGAISGSAPPDNIGGVFTTSFENYYTGTFRFFLKSDDGAKLYVNNVLVINHDGLHPDTELSGDIHLPGVENGAGYHSIRLEYFEAESLAGLQLVFQKITGARLFGRRHFGDGSLFNGAGGSEGNYRANNWYGRLYRIPTSTLTANSSSGNASFNNISLNQPVTLTPSYPGGTFSPSSQYVTGSGPHPFTLTSSPPSISDTGNQTISEDGIANINFTISDYQTAAGNLTVTVTSSDTGLIPVSAVTLGGSGGARTAAIRPLPNLSGSSTITFTVTDGEGKTASDSFVVTVNGANDAPVAGTSTSIQLNGVNQYVQAPAGVWFGNTFTVEAWVYVVSHKNWARLFDFGNGEGVNNVLVAFGEGTTGRPRFDIYQGSGALPQYIISSNAVPTGTWTHLAFTRDSAGTGRIYMNGVETAAGAMWAPLNVNRTLNYFGRSNWSADSYADASLADVRIWNVARTQAEILASRHRALPPQSPGLILNYRFDPATGFTALDSASSTENPAQQGAQNGTLVNGPTFRGNDSALASLLQIPVLEDSSMAIYLPGFDVDSSITYSPAVTSGSISALPGAPSGLYLYAPAPNSSGNATVNYTVSDGSLSAISALPIQVTAVNDPPVVGPGTALAFNGVNQHLDVPDGVWFGNTFTVEGWVLVHSYANWSRFFDFGNGPANNNVLGALTGGTGGQPVLAAYQGGSELSVISSQMLPLHVWTHLAFSRDSNGTGHIYINGVETGTGPLLAPPNINRTQNFIGRSNWPDAHANGNFADVRIWNTARSISEITNNWHALQLAATNGLIARYRLNEGSGTTAFDSQTIDGAQNAVMVNGPGSLRIDAPANSISFNGTTQYAQVLDSAALSITGPITLEAWIRPAAIGQVMGIVEKYGSNDGGYILRLEGSGKISAAAVDRAFASSGVTGNTVVPAGAWTHVAASWDGALMQVFVNGVLDGIAYTTRNPKDGATPLFIGAVGDNQNYKFNGRIGDVRVWNVARSASDIAAWQGGVPSNTPGLVLNYRFTEGSLAVLNDVATADGTQTGALVGTPTWPPAETTLAMAQTVKYTEDTLRVLVLPAFDIEGNALTYSAVSASTGAISQVSGATYNYTPPANYNGPVTITYTVSDGTTSMTSRVYMLGVAVEDAPTLAAIPTQPVSEGSPTVQLGLSLTDGDPELTQGLSITATSSNTNLIRHPGIFYSSPAESAQLTYKPRPGASGTATVTVVVTDLASSLTATQTFNINVSAIDDPPNAGPGTSLAFNGTNRVNIPAFEPNLPLNELTVEFWQKVSVRTDSSVFQLVPDSTANRLNAHVPWSDGKVYWDFGNISAGGRLAYTPPVSIVNSWQHFAFVVSRGGNYMKIFRNGIEEATKPGVSSVAPGLRDLQLGGFVGQLAEFRVWKVARTSEEILATMNASLSNTAPDLVAYYRFNQRPTTVLTDFASAVGQGGSQDGVLIADAADNDPIWQTTTPSQAWQSSDPDLKALQIVAIPDGSTNVLYLPAWDAENLQGLIWTNVTASTGTVSYVNGGLWSYAAPVSYNGPATISYTVRDTGGHANNASINLRIVVARNDSPTIGVIPNKTAEEDTALIEIPFTVDDDQEVSALSITPTALENGSLIEGMSVPAGGNFRTLNVVPKPGVIGTVRIQLFVQDQGNKTVSTAFDLRIEPKPAFSVVDLGVVPGKSSSFGTAINDRGAVTGFMADNPDLQSNPVGFYFNGIENGGVVEMNPAVRVGPDPLGSPFRPWAINNFYNLAGAGQSGGQTVAWQKQHDGTIMGLGVLAGGSIAEVRAMNDAGVLAGFGSIGGGKRRAFTFAPGDGGLTDLGVAAPPFNDQSEAFGLNVSNHIVGAIWAADGRRRAMFRSNGVMRPLFDVPDDTNSVANGVNAFDQVVGRSTAFVAGDGALGFDGVNDQVVVTNLLNNTNGVSIVAGNAAHTVEGWIRMDSLPAVRSWPLLLGNNQPGNSHHWLANNNGTLTVGIHTAGAATVPFTLGAWMHIAASYNPPNLTVYVNGQPFSTNAVTGADLQGIPLVLGNPQGQNSFHGAMDEIRVWRSFRTADQISANYTRRLTGSETDLVAYFAFDEGTGTASTTSLADGALVGALSGSPTWTVRGGLPSADLTVSDPTLQFDGVSSRVAGPVLPLANSSFSIELWARRAQINDLDYVLGHGMGDDNRALHVGFRPDNSFTFAFYGNDMNTPIYTDTAWHHWACTYDATTRARKIYRDGVLVASGIASANYQGTGNLVLGMAPRIAGSWFKGAIDDVRVWSVARTAGEIAANLNVRMTGTMPGLIANYSFDEGGGAVTVNRASGATDASLQGAISWSGRDNGTFRAFLFERESGRLTSLGTVADGGASEAAAINDFGQIVGTAAKSGGQRAFFYSAGRLNDLNDLLPEAEILDQWTLESAAGINRSGAIVGTGMHGGLKRAFLALPATVIGRPVIRPQGAVEKLPYITILKKHRADDDNLNSFYWSIGERKLYAIRPVTAKIEWFTSFDETVGSGTNIVSNTNRIVSVTVNVWPKKPTIHIAGAPVDLQPAVTAANYTFQSLIYVTNSATVEPSAKVFTSPTPGYTVAFYLKNDGLAVSATQPPYFEVIRTVTAQDTHAGLTNPDWTIGTEVADPAHAEYGGKNGYVLYEKAAYDGVGNDRAYDRGTRLGPILPVNKEDPDGMGTANPDSLLVVWYRTNRIGVAWASVPVQYGLKWPADSVVDRIVIASQLGSGYLDAASYPAKTIYNQPDPSLPGFNPNEEHAYMPVDTLYAIRDDLNTARNYSEPYALLKFRDPSTSRWRMRVFKVVAEQAPHFFTYTGTVGKEVQPPLPLSLLPLSTLSYQHPLHSEVAWEDYKGKIYARQAGPEGSHTNLTVRWFYPMQPGFFHPDATVNIGDPLAWLDQRQAGALSSPNQSVGARGLPLDVVYDIRWDDAAVLQIGETLIHSRRGLPDVFNMANARVIFDSYAAADPGASSLIRSIGALSGTALDPLTVSSTSNSLARFYDPISTRTLKANVVIPTSLKRQNIAGKEYFTDLPWFLKIRLAYDPINNWLLFSGHLDENFGVGEPLLLPNVLTARERDRLKLLADGDGGWAALMDSLYELTRNPNEVDLYPADGQPDKDLRLGLKNLLTTNFFAVPVERRTIVQSNTVGCYTNILTNPATVECQTNYYNVEVWPLEYLKKPESIEEALQTDARVVRDIALRLIRAPGSAPAQSSYSVTRQVVGETLESGPKVLTTGLGGVPAAQTRPGNALAFNGTSGLVTLGLNDGAALDLTGTPFTIEFWAKVTSPTTEQYLVGQPAGSASLGRLRIGFRDGGKFAFDLGTTPATVSIFNTGSTYTDTNWHHWAGTFDPETKVQTIYRDGVVVGTRTDSALSYAGFGALELGRFGTSYFGGSMDEIRVWKTARTVSQIRSNMNKRMLGSGVEPDLEILYRCDESAGPLASHALLASGGYPGVLTGGVALVASDAPAGIPPRYITIAENNDPSLGGLPVAVHVIRVDDGPFIGDLKVLPGDNVFDERLTLRHSSEFGGDPQPVTFQWYYKPIGADFDPTDLPVVTDVTAEFPGDMRGWTPYTNYKPVDGRGVNYVTTGEGGESGLITLSDNAFICRYKGFAVNLNSASAWSGWVGDPAGTPDQPRAALAEGWVKRVIRGLNPFDARTSDFHSSPASTFASMLIQAGSRYEGPIAFNPSADAINGVGLIEAYTTVLNRARGLSIDGVPQVDFNPANNSLLLAATKLSDLYTLLGNEAYADASDPTIGFGSGSRDYGSLASSIFAFQNQLDSMLEEELTLLRGRDDSAAGVGARPVYNRLFWNFTLGEGEVAYQQNYNISDQNLDGFIDERDARILYPQGHGDAWGHYLEATKQHYALLRHPHFTWVPRSELVSVAGAAVKVDFLDERKFAVTAAAKAKAGAEIVDLTYRLNYVDDPSGQWQGYKDTSAERGWGVTEWARRAGMGAYFDWLAANTILPSEDPNTNHVGIDKIDRQTVREIREIPAQAAEIQTRLDQADAGLNPLGLAKGVVPFDIDPSLVGGAAGIAGKTHYEQIQDRALKAMRNALSVWDEVNKSTEALRRNQDSVEEFTANVVDQERDYKNRLIEIYGYPHAGDIGAGKTYPSGYDGPDLYHYMYVPVPDFDGVTSRSAADSTAYFTKMNLGIDVYGDVQSGAFGKPDQEFFFPTDFARDLANPSPTLSETNRILAVVYPRTTARYAFSTPASWGVRRSPGEIQLALSDLIQSEARLRAAIKADDALFAEINDRVSLLNERYDFRAAELKLQTDLANTKIAFASAIVGLQAGKALALYLGNSVIRAADAAQEGLPKNVGLATDATSFARSAIKFSGAIVENANAGIAGGLDAASQIIEKIGIPAAEGVVRSKIDSEAFDYEIRQQVDELERILRQIATSKLEGIRLAEAVNQAGGRYLAALSKGQRLLEERVAYRTRVAGRTTEARYQDMTFRIFRNDALQKYRATFDLAQRYVFLAATAYDYESNLLGTDTRGGRNFLTDIIRQRSLGQMLNGEPVVGRSGLADSLARMGSNFDVLKTQLGFNNPQTETARFSLRNELFRLRPGSEQGWRATLSSKRVANLWDIPEFRRYCRSFAAESAGPQPGIVIRFPSTVTSGQNFFTRPLGGGDSAYDASRFATKIRSAGVWFTGYNGLGLSQTPRIYLVPAGSDVLSSPTPNDFVTRGWRVVDQALPVPFPIGANRLSDPTWIPVNDSLGGSFAEVRRFSAFRAYHDSGGFDPNEVTSDSRLIGRSVWNTDWVLIIPGQTFLANPNAGLDRFINSVSDIKLFFQTYSYSGN